MMIVTNLYEGSNLPGRMWARASADRAHHETERHTGLRSDQTACEQVI